MHNAEEIGNHLMNELKNISHLKNIRGKGLMIGFDLPEELKDLRKNLLFNQHIFTGEAKPNVIRLLPSLALRKKDADEFIESIKEEIETMMAKEVVG